MSEASSAAATRAAIAEAIAKRAQEQKSAADELQQELRAAREHDTRQEFRRLLDPGIARGLAPASFEATIKMLSTIAENLLKDTENEKFQKFKPTNPHIKKNLVEVKGALEYAIALGFRAEVHQYQPFYVFHLTPKRLDDLRIGESVLKEAMERITRKAEEAKRNKVDPKAVNREIAQKVKLAYEDDRKEKKRRDELERQVREARAAAALVLPPLPAASSPHDTTLMDEEDDDDEEDVDDGETASNAAEESQHFSILPHGAPGSISLTGGIAPATDPA